MADTAGVIIHKEGWREILAAHGPQIEAEGRACDLSGTFVSANLDFLHQHGFFALGVPKDLGGGGASYKELADMLRGLGRWCGSTALTLSMHTHQVAVATWRRRHEKAPTDALLKRVANEGLRLVSSGGSDWLPGSAVAEKVEGGFRITGRKIFSSGCRAGGLLMTSAIFHDPEQGEVVLHFPVPFNAEGVHRTDTWDTLGMRGTGSDDVRLENVFVPDAAIGVRRPAGRWHPLFHLISQIALPLVYSVYAGVADGARDATLALVRRSPPREPTALLGIGEMENAHAAMSMAYDTIIAMASEAMPGPQTTHRITTLRTLLGRFAIETGDLAMKAAGGAAFHRANGIEWRFRDLQAARFHPLQERPQQIYATRMALGLPIDG